jgi:hypothetical protein
MLFYESNTHKRQKKSYIHRSGVGLHKILNENNRTPLLGKLN